MPQAACPAGCPAASTPATMPVTAPHLPMRRDRAPLRRAAASPLPAEARGHTPATLLPGGAWVSSASMAHAAHSAPPWVPLRAPLTHRRNHSQRPQAPRLAPGLRPVARLGPHRQPRPAPGPRPEAQPGAQQRRARAPPPRLCPAFRTRSAARSRPPPRRWRRRRVLPTQQILALEQRSIACAGQAGLDGAAHAYSLPTRKLGNCSCSAWYVRRLSASLQRPCRPLPPLPCMSSRNLHWRLCRLCKARAACRQSDAAGREVKFALQEAGSHAPRCRATCVTRHARPPSGKHTRTSRT